MTIEGIIIHKVAFKERHTVATLLLRSGKLASILFYGGQGGGKKKKASIIDLGHMIRVGLKKSKYGNELHQASEWKEIWLSEKIREDFTAYSLMCFYFELIKKISFSENFDDKNHEADETMTGVFRVLSNALFFLDSTLKNGCFNMHSHLFIFLVKLSLDQGVLPDRDECMVTGEEFGPSEPRSLSFHHGGFVKMASINQEDFSSKQSTEVSVNIFNGMNEVLSKKYQELSSFSIDDSSVSKVYLDFFFHQFQMTNGQFKSLDLLY